MLESGPELARVVEELSREVERRKQAEEDLRRTTEELRRSNLELEQFAAVASHDLQEPLRMVAGYAQLLGRRYRGRLDADADEFIGYLVDGATRMQSLIQDLLTYARVGKARRLDEPTDLSRALQQALERLEAGVRESAATVTADPLPVLSADPVEAVQLFQNLVGNALKYRRPEAPPRVHVSARREGPNWIISVRDNGIGIDAQYAGRLFVPFQRLHTRAEYPGTGIGLALCRKIVEGHGGRIWIDPQPGPGTVLCFALPDTRGVTA